jgi:hypothetical protein
MLPSAKRSDQPITHSKGSPEKEFLTRDMAQQLIDSNGHAAIGNDITSVGKGAFFAIAGLRSVDIGHSTLCNKVHVERPGLAVDWHQLLQMELMQCFDLTTTVYLLSVWLAG